MRFLNQCVDPGAQLIEGERFDHVVIRPELKQITLSYQPANGPNDCSLNSDGIPFCVEVIVVSGGVAKLVEECMTCNASRGREGARVAWRGLRLSTEGRLIRQPLKLSPTRSVGIPPPSFDPSSIRTIRSHVGTRNRKRPSAAWDWCKIDNSISRTVTDQLQGPIESDPQPAAEVLSRLLLNYLA